MALPIRPSPVPASTLAIIAGDSSVNLPNNPSADYAAMAGYWDMVETILDGTDAMRVAGTKYLPQFVNEQNADYEYRRKNSKFTNIYRDIVEGLAAKPFSKELELAEETSETIEELCEDIDGQGNLLHVFAANLFFSGINDAIGWILVDKAPVPKGASIADEHKLGAKPYWVFIPAKKMLAVYSALEGGKEIFIHARIHEPTCIREGYRERTVNRVREFNREAYANINKDGVATTAYRPATYILWEEKQDPITKKTYWEQIESGDIAIGIIAIVPFVTGRRKGSAWQFIPPMQDAAYLQIEHYQQETNLKCIKTQSCFPMLSGNGINPPLDSITGKQQVVPVGPLSVLFAPPHEGGSGSWTYIEPNSSSLTFLAADVKATESLMRELGRQPLTAQSGNLTVVTTAFAAAKGNSAVQAWALRLKDTLELALKYTCQWLNDTCEPEVSIHTDFAVDMESDKAPDFLIKLREMKEISRGASLAEAKRRDFLGPEYDAEEDMELILQEIPAEPTDEDVVDALPGNKEPDTEKGNMSYLETGDDLVPGRG